MLYSTTFYSSSSSHDISIPARSSPKWSIYAGSESGWTSRLRLVRQARSGAGVLGSIPIAAVAAGVFVVLVFARFVSLMFALNDPSEAGKDKAKEAPMNRILVVLSSLTETAWALGVSVSAGLLLLS